MIKNFVWVVLFITVFSVVYSLAVGVLFKRFRKASQIELSRRGMINRNQVSGSQTSQVILTRTHSYVDRLRTYQVYIDGMCVDQILDGERKIYKLGPGDHELTLKIDWCGAAPVKFHLNQGEMKSLSCRPNLDGIKFLLLLWYVSFGRNQYIRLKWQ